MLAAGRAGHVELVVARRQEVDVLAAQNVVGKESLGRRGVVDAIALDAVARVDQEEVDAVVVGSLAEVFGEGDVVAPVPGVLRPVVRLVSVPFCADSIIMAVSARDSL